MVRGRKPPFLKGRFGGNVNINGGSADSLSPIRRVRLYDECVEVGGEGGEAVRRVAVC